MQCSCCRQECESPREYSLSAVDPNGRKTIHTFHLCAICRIVYRINPLRVAARSRAAAPREPLRRRA
jgi:hypothetical protein